MGNEQILNLTQQSFLTNYYDRSVIENQLKNTEYIADEEEFMKLYGPDQDIYLEGFNRNNKMYIGPKATPHSVIHGILHNLSSSFENENRIYNGISYKNSEGYINYINEGLTDYLATKISKEPERHYLQGVRFFRGLDNILQEVYGENQMLFESYICNNTYFLKNIIDNYCTYKYRNQKVDWNFFINNFVFFNNDTMDELIKNIHKNILKKTKQSIFNKNPKYIDFNKFNEINIVGLIKKAYYNLKLNNLNASDELISKGMRAMILENDLQYISNKKGIRELIRKAMQNYSLIDVINNNYELFNDVPIDNFINGMTK